MAKHIGKQMRCTSKSMELASFVVGFDIGALDEGSKRQFPLHVCACDRGDRIEQQDMIVGRTPVKCTFYLLNGDQTSFFGEVATNILFLSSLYLRCKLA